jgi:hypothetical protein
MVAGEPALDMADKKDANSRTRKRSGRTADMISLHKEIDAKVQDHIADDRVPVGGECPLRSCIRKRPGQG